MLINRLGLQSQIISYTGNFVKDEIRRFRQRIINQWLQLEFCAYPMQQKQLKMEIKLLILQRSLPYKIFIEIFPQAVEIAKSKERIYLIFEFFRQLAENPLEICNRVYWLEYLTAHEKFPKGERHYYITQCGTTQIGLVSSIFGGNHTKLINYKFKECTESRWKKISTTFNANSHQLKKVESSCFFVYSLALKNLERFHGHVILIVQYLNSKSQIQYGFFQSFIGEYCLKEYLEKGNNHLGTKEFAIFLIGLRELLLSKQWSSTMDSFYTTYFNLKKGFDVGGPNYCNNRVFMKWCTGNVNDIIIQNAKMKNFKTISPLPKILVGSCNSCRDKQLEGLFNQNTEYSQIIREKLDHLDQKYREIYDRNCSITSLEHFKIDLNSLGLDLNEEGMMEVPARDENGKLVREKDDVKWINRVITLEHASREIIAELNKLIQNGIYTLLENGKRRVLLDINKEPFLTYHSLGIPHDKFTIDENDEKLIWMRRVVDALVIKGHIKQLERVTGHGYHILV